MLRYHVEFKIMSEKYIITCKNICDIFLSEKKLQAPKQDIYKSVSKFYKK